MSSEKSRRLAWWHWVLIAIAVLLIVTYILTFTLEAGDTSFR